MANVKRYVSVRLYLPDSKIGNEADNTAGVDVQHSTGNLGTFGPVLKSKRQQYHDSRLLLPVNGRYRYVSACAQVMAFFGILFLISFNAENWKAVVMFFGLL